jgi:hypothetical protein
MKSKAQQLAEERYPYGYPKEADRLRAAFIAGLQVGVEFAEWMQKKGYVGVIKERKFLYVKGYYSYTTEELFEIFLNEKHDTTTH